MATKKQIQPGDSKNLETLKRAFLSGDVGLSRCYNKKEKKYVTVLTAFQTDDSGDIILLPFAQFFDCNPYDILIPPTADNGKEKIK